MDNRESRNRDDEFATHYYGNERDLRERDRIAREERRAQTESQREFSRKNRGRKEQERREEFARKASRESDIGREPFKPRRKYHRAKEDSYYADNEINMSSETGRRNWKQLYSDFMNDFTILFQKESSLIRTELGEKADLVKQGALSITTGTIVSFVGIQAIAATIVIALGNVMPWWAAALVTGVALLLIGWAMMASAKRKFTSDNLTPYRSMESFEHMGHMLKEKKDEFTRH